MSLHLPNIKRLFLPDEGHIICDTDLDRADLQVVVWEANDEDLKLKLREGVDIHTANAADIFGDSQAAAKRPLAKAGVHATNYGASARTLARALGVTVREAEFFQQRWFAAHPGIRDWHDRVLDNLSCHREVRNRFGFRRYFLDRIESLLPQALAWIPQSTVAVVTNRGILNLYNSLPQVEVLLQVHDSVVWQVRKTFFRDVLPEVQKCLLVEIPYDDPLTIPVGLKASDKSWGDCVDFDWEGRKAA